VKVLFVNNVYRRGSTGRIVYDIHVSLQKRGIESVVCYGRGRHVEEDNVHKYCLEIEAKIHSLFMRFGMTLQYGGLFFATKRLCGIINKESPDVVHLHCLNGSCVNVFLLLRFLANKKCLTVVTNHAEFYYTGSCGHAYDCIKWTSKHGCGRCPRLNESTCSRLFDNTGLAWKRMKRAFSLFSKENLVFTAVSPWVLDRSKLSPIVNSFNCVTVPNGLDTTVFYYRRIIRTKRIINVSKNKSLVYFPVASFIPVDRNDNKGGYYLVEIAKRLPDILFIVSALYQRIDINLPSNVLIWGGVTSSDEMAELYSVSSATLVLSRRETYSMTCAESLCCGTPVVGFKAGGPETIAIPDYSCFVDYGDVTGIMSSLLTCIERKTNKETVSERALPLYSKERMIDSYCDVYSSHIKKSHS